MIIGGTNGGKLISSSSLARDLHAFGTLPEGSTANPPGRRAFSFLIGSQGVVAKHNPTRRAVLAG
jgi:hypothetical protein